MNKEFPSEEKYLKFVKKLKEYRNLQLTTRNCGIFAYALKQVFKVGELFNIGGFYHILFKYEGKYYDGKTIYHSFRELEDSHWRECMNKDYEDDEPILSELPDEEAFELIKKGTCNTLNVETFIEIINKELNIE